MASIDCYVLDVGQGMGNFIAIYDDAGTLTNTILVDFGTEGSTKKPEPALKLVVSLLKTMAQPTIDVLLVSHTDKDHHNMLPKLLAAFGVYDPDHPARNTLVVKEVMFGGSMANVTESFYTELVKYMPVGEEPDSFTAHFSSFPYNSGFGPINPFIIVGNVQIYMMMGNLWAMPDRGEFEGGEWAAETGEGYNKNTVSMVLLVRANNSAFVLTGDATGQTIAACNYMIAKMRQFFTFVEVATVPHHGSSSSAFDLKSLTGIDPQQNIVDFAKYIDPYSLVASAEKHGSWDHPALSVLELFWKANRVHSQALYNEYDYFHPFTSWIKKRTLRYPLGQGWPAHEGRYTAFTQTGTYTTLYGFNTPPAADIWPPQMRPINPPPPAIWRPYGVTWKFHVDRGGRVSLTRESSRDTPTAELLDRLAAPPVPPVPVGPPAGAARPRRLRAFP
ncbi:hypothetical protein [Dactylosporangium sp. CA-233914]|uniref:hypothetical protein n=1 Tax=Dactylosporangium sp. CA-233914 TaxID=3239934 RepID=UPI003D909CD5